MHKYFEKNPPKIKEKKTDSDDEEQNGDEEEGEIDIEDGSLDAFADKVIEDKMRELNRGAGLNEDSEDDDLLYADSDNEDGEQGESQNSD